MKQTIEIEVPEGKMTVLENNLLKFIDKPAMPKTWSEFCKVHPVQSTETFINSSGILCATGSFGNCPRDEYFDANYLPTQEAAEAHLALMQLHQLRDYYRQGWAPNWSDNNSKWGIFNRRNEIRVQPIINRAGFLSFQTEEIAEEFLKNFRDLIEQAKDLI